MKHIHVYVLLLVSVFLTSCGQNQTGLPKDNIKSETKESTTPQAYKDSLAQASLLKTEISKDKENKNSPVDHLKSPDYFDVKKFPISTIAISKVVSVSEKTIRVTGNLTIKGVTNPVTFPAEMEVKEGVVKANGKLSIDRTDWGIRYRSGKFYEF